MGGANPRNNVTAVVKEDERSCSSESMSQGSSVCVPGGMIYEKGVSAGGGGEDEWLSLGSSFPGGGGAGMGETVLQVGREGERKADSHGIWFFSKAGGLPAASAPHWSVRPFILWGYRDTMSWRECWESMATVHNEAGNVWTHVIGLAIFVSLTLHELARDDKELHHKVVATTYLFATNFCMASSAAFHLFTPHSKVVYERALRIDMTGIALVIIASFLVGLHYGYWCHPFLAQVYLSIVAVLSCIAMAWPHMPRLLNNFNLSVTFFASFVAFALVPLFHWVSVVGGLRSEQASLFFWKLLITFGLYALGFVFYGAQIPERFYAGRFDIVGHSHQLWHIAVLAGALEFYFAMQAYGEYRQVHTCLA